MYYDIGIVLYTPSISRNIEDPYELGDIVPILSYFVSPMHDRPVVWMENIIEWLKVGDPIAFNLSNNIMYPIKVIESLGVRAVGLDF